MEFSKCVESGDEILVRENGIGTGSFALDEAISKVIMGIPRGRVLQFAGRPGSGKTLLSLLCLAEMQKQDPDAYGIFIDCEYTFDKVWAKKLGVQLDRLLIIPENNAKIIEERLVGIPAKEAGKPKSKAGLLDLELAEGSSGLGLIIIDSIASIMPPLEETSVSSKANIAPLSRWLTPFLRKITPLLSRTGISLIGINQLRADIGAFSPHGGVVETSPGGRSFFHSQSLCLHLKKLGGKDNIIIDSETKDVIGHTIEVKITKSKIAHGRDKKIKINMLYEEGVTNEYKNIVDLGIKYGFIERPNNRTYIIKGDYFKVMGIDKYEDDNKIDGRAAIDEFYKNSPEDVKILIEAIKSKINKAEETTEE